MLKIYRFELSSKQMEAWVQETDATHWEIENVYIATRLPPQRPVCITHLVNDHPDLLASVTKEIEDQRSREVDDEADSHGY